MFDHDNNNEFDSSTNNAFHNNNNNAFDNNNNNNMKHTPLVHQQHSFNPTHSVIMQFGMEEYHA